MFRSKMNVEEPKIVEKLWGQEIVVANNDEYCSKVLCFYSVRVKTSLHYHMVKHETMYVVQGCVDVDDGTSESMRLHEGDVLVIPPGHPHRMTPVTVPLRIMEASTHHKDEDVVRLIPSKAW